MIGDNDFCSEFCYNDINSILKEHESDIITALRILKKNLPRTFVNIIPPPSKYLFLSDNDSDSAAMQYRDIVQIYVPANFLPIWSLRF